MSTFSWVPASLSQQSIPPGVVRVGTDEDGSEIYAGRAHHEGDILPAKVIPSKNACYVSYGGEEILKDQFEVLVPAMFSWQFSSEGQVPPGAVEAGITCTGETLYYGRVTHDGSITPGKIVPSHGTCYYPFDGEERNSREYEVLVLMQTLLRVRRPPPPPHGPGYPHMQPGVLFYPVHPAYFYPYPPPSESVTVVKHPPIVDDAAAEPELSGETVELPWSSYRWVPACLSQRSIPPGALRVGTDADGSEIYAGRAHHEGDILPAKVIPSKNACYVSYGGEEVPKDQFEVLVPAMFSWQFSSEGQVPPGAVEAGITCTGETLYYGRVTHDGCTTPGKIVPSHGTCYYPFDGEERNSREYEVLVLL